MSLFAWLRRIALINLDYLKLHACLCRSLRVYRLQRCKSL
jgi:hypothetical protein